ncbi:MAG: TonB-dependent receptor [Bdellovibrionales bacterium]|nr:TonB-dependent receptor [Bdellovibrionales bacterium]
MRGSILILLFCCFVAPFAGAIPKIVVHGKRDRSLSSVENTETPGKSVGFGDGGAVGRILGEEPALQIIAGTDSTGVPQFLIRGQDTVENRYFLYGFPLSNARLSQPDLELLSTHFFPSLELYAGGVPVHFGEDGLGGAVEFGLTPWEAGTQVIARGGSLGALSATADVRGGESLRLGVEYTQSNEDFLYFDDNGTPLNFSDDHFRRRENNRMHRYVFFPRYLVQSSRVHQLELISWHSGLYREIPGAVRGATGGNVQESFQLTGLRSQWTPPADVAIESHLYLRHNLEELNGVTPIVGTAVQDYSASHLAIGERSQLRLWSWNLDFVAGAAWERYSLYSRTTADLSTQDRLQIPFGVTGVWKLGSDWELRPALQAHLYDYQTSGTRLIGNSGQNGFGLQSRYFLFSPRLGSEWMVLPSLRWRALVGHFYRAPSLFELFGSPVGVSPAPNLRYESAFKTETGLDWSVDLEGALRRVQVSYTVAFQQARDLITYIANAQNSSVATNIGASRILTQELQGTAEFSFGWRLQASAVWMDSDNLSRVSYETGKDLPLRPDWRLQTSTSYKLGDFEFGYQLSWVGPAYGDTANTRKLGGVLYHSANVAWRTKRWGVFLLEGRNLGDATTAASTYQNTTIETVDYTTGYSGYPAPGRRVYLTWTYSI